MTEPDLSSGEETAGSRVIDLAARCAGLAVGTRQVYHAVLRRFAATGRPPEPAELEAAARPLGLAVGQLVAELAAADLIGLDDAGRIRMAYPFSAEPTPHVVAIAGGARVHSMCALDALGIPPMLGADAVITSVDPLTGAPVKVSFSGGLASWDPPDAVLYVGRAGCDGRAEDVTCGYLNFFADPASAGLWASQHPQVTGSVLDHARAEKLGAETFGPLLRGGS
jgi:hypothetical protein